MQPLHLALCAATLSLAACDAFTGQVETEASESAEIIHADTLSAETITPEDILTPEEAAIRSAQANLLMLTEYVTFLEQLKVDTGEYPQTRSMRSAFNALKDLAEVREVTLPETPQTEAEEARSRFAYRSDGSDYKLVAERTGDCFAVRDIDPERIDPKRASGPVDCYGYGFWTEGAETW